MRKSHKQKIEERKFKRLENKIINKMAEELRYAIDKDILDAVINGKVDWE